MEKSNKMGVNKYIFSKASRLLCLLFSLLLCVSVGVFISQKEDNKYAYAYDYTAASSNGTSGTPIVASSGTTGSVETNMGASNYAGEVSSGSITNGDGGTIFTSLDRIFRMSDFPTGGFFVMEVTNTLSGATTTKSLSISSTFNGDPLITVVRLSDGQNKMEIFYIKDGKYYSCRNAVAYEIPLYLNTSTNGNDTSDGDSAGEPLKTYAKVEELLCPGAVVILQTSMVISSGTNTFAYDYMVKFKRAVDTGYTLDTGSPMFQITGAVVTFRNITIEGGSSTVSEIIISSSAEVIFGENTVIQNCVNSNSGGAITLNTSSTLRLNDTEIKNCGASLGGGVYASGGTITVDGLYAHDNTVTSSDNNGSVFHTIAGTNITINRGTFESNSNYTISSTTTTTASEFFTMENATFNNVANVASEAIYITGYSTVSISNSSFTGCKGVNSAVVIRSSPSTVVSHCLFSDNETTLNAYTRGSALTIFNQSTTSSVTANVNHCEFYDNTGVYCGALNFYGTSASTLCSPTISNCVFNNNSAISSSNNIGMGGAIYFGAYITSCQISDCTITNNSVDLCGGGIYLKEISNTANITGCNISNNLACSETGYNAGNGSAIYFKGGAGTVDDNLNISNCQINNNYACSNGTVYIQGLSSTSKCNVRIENTSVSANDMYSGYGVGLCFYTDVADATIDNCEFIGNISATSIISRGGAFYAGVLTSLTSFTMASTTISSCATHYYSAGYIKSAEVTLTDNELTGNMNINSTDVNMGVLHITDITNGTNSVIDNLQFNNNVGSCGVYINSTIDIQNSSFDSNSCFSSGGALFIRVESNKTVNVTDCDFTNNSAREGGAVYAYIESTSSKINFTNCDVIGNSVSSEYGSGYGSGIYAYNNSNPGTEQREYSFTNCNVKNNISNQTYGGGLYIYGVNAFNIIGGEYYNNNTSGIYISECRRTHTITDVKVKYNSINGIYDVSISTSITANLTNCDISYNGLNNSNNSYSGGVYFNTEGPMIINITECNISGNANTYSSYGGCGVSVLHGTLDILNSSINNNDGGTTHNAGVYFAGSVITVEDSNINGNTGDGIFSDLAPLTIENSSISYNGNYGVTNDGEVGGQTVTVSDSFICNNNIAGLFCTGTGTGTNIFTNCSLSYNGNSASLTSGTITAGVYVNCANQTLEFNSCDISYNVGSGIRTIGSLELNDCTITNNDNSLNSSIGYGGGIYATTAPTLVNVNISNNTAEYGGGIAIDSSLDCTLSGGILSSNTAEYGGGLYTDEAKLTILDFSFTDNVSNIGSVIYSASHKDIYISDCVITGNNSTSGGIVYATGTSADNVDVSYTDCNISNNKDDSGKVFHLSDYTNTTLTSCVIEDNRGADVLGNPVASSICVDANGVCVIEDSSLTLSINGQMIVVNANGTLTCNNVVMSAVSVMSAEDSVISAVSGSTLNIIGGSLSYTGTTTSNKGGVMSINGIATVKDISLNGNEAVNSGGAIYVGTSGNLTLSADVENNTAGNGGAVYVDGTLVLCGGEISSNTAGNGGGIYVGSTGTVTLNSISTFDIVTQTNHTTFPTISSNTAQNGGGIYVVSGGNLVINCGTIGGATSANGNIISGYGGGIYVSTGATATINENAIISNNQASASVTNTVCGLGIANLGTTTINGGTFKNNSRLLSTYAVQGGNIYSESDINISNAIIEDGTSDFGSAIFLSNCGLVYISDTTFEDNTASGDSNAKGVIYSANNALVIDDCQFTNNSGRTIYGTNSSLRLENTSFYKSSGGHIYYENSSTGDVYINNCSFEAGLEQNNLYFNSLKSLTIQNSGITNSLTNEGLYINNVVRADIKNCNFSYIYGSKDNAGDYYSNSNVLTIAGSVIMTVNIEGCSFTNNRVSNCGGINIINTNANSMFIIEDCSFENNVVFGYVDGDTYSGKAINVGGTGKTTLSGEISVVSNYCGYDGGGIYVNSGAKLFIQRGSNLIVKENLSSVSCVDASITVADVTEYVMGYVSGGANTNLLVASSSASITFAGGLASNSDNENSEIYISYGSEMSSDGAAIISLVTGGVISQEDISCFKCDENTTCAIKYNASTNKIMILPKLSTFAVIVSDGIYRKHVATVENDGSYGVVNSNLIVSGTTSYTTMYYANSAGTVITTPSGITGWVYDSPKFSEIGEYYIYCKVTDNVTSSSIIVPVMIKIVKDVLHVITTPKAQVSYNALLSTAVFSNWLVEDSFNNAIVGTWSFGSADQNRQATDTTTKYTVTFTPFRDDLYSSEAVTAEIYLDIGYSIVYYSSSNFYASRSSTGVYSGEIGVTTLGAMISRMNNNGFIIFSSTYRVNNGSENIVATKNVYLVRYQLNNNVSIPIISIMENASPNSLSLSSNGGKIIFEGDCSYSGVRSGYASLIENSGILTLGNGVVIRNFTTTYNSSTGLGSRGGAIYNNASGIVNLNGCEIYNNSVERGSGTSLGGAIYNLGSMVINGGKFYQNSALVNGANSGNGGFVYSTGSIVINGGSIYANKAGNGGAIYIYGGSVTLNGGEIKQNTATTSGGGIYVSASSSLKLNGTSVENNYAGSSGGGIEIAENGNVIDSFDVVVSAATIQSIEEKNYVSNSKNDNNSTLYISLICGIIAIAVIGLVCFMSVKKRRKSIYNKTKK